MQLSQYFLPRFTEIDPSTAYVGDYQFDLVVLSLAIASLSAYVALSVADRIVAASSARGRLAWSSAGAVSMGGGIWGMHFIGMLAFSLPCGVGYDPALTIVSMLPGVLASGAALGVISREREPRLGRLSIGSILMGGGIGAMHYTGMAAMRPEALLLYDVGMVGVSVLVAVTLSFLSFLVHFRLRPILASFPVLATLIAATAMGFAVACMHYTAMYAANFYPSAGAVIAGLQLPINVLSMMIAMFTVLVASATLAASFAGRQFDLVAVLSTEMSQRAEVERDAQRTRARTQAIVDAVADAIVTIDRGGRIRQWSRGAERVFGYSGDEILGKDLTILMPQPHRTRHDQYVNAFITTRVPKIIGIGRELTALRKDGSEFPIELTVSEVQGIDEVLFTGILRDITDRKRAEQDLINAREQAEAASRAKSEFLATMSHEIRTPMNGVLGMANLLVGTPLNERQGRLTENLLRSGNALMGIINDILDFSKIEAGRLELLETEFDPREIIAEVADLFSERCAAKGLEFVYFVDEAVPNTVRGDPIRLRQVCTNLVGNAIKFTERGEILVEMVISEDLADHAVLSIAVVDTGIGIPADKHDSVFESFHQVDSSMTRARGGSGLGLAIVKQLVTLMDGKVGVESEVGRGSRFWFTIKVKKSTADVGRGLRRIGRELSVLLVDGNAVSGHVTSQYLTNWGVEADIHSSIADATEAFEASLAEGGRQFDAAIIDIKGLGAAAVELSSAIRAARPQSKTEVIYLVDVANLMGGEVDERDAFAVLSKPVRPSELFDTLASLSAGVRTRRVSSFLSRRAGRKKVNFDARILVAEDNAINQDVVIGMLSNLGCKVVSAANGRAAAQSFAQDRFDLILMDCEMPVMDGFQAATRIRETERLMSALPENRGRPKRIPIIAVTAHALPEMRDRCIAAGMDDFLTKPFDDVQLADILERHLRAGGVSAPAAAASEAPKQAAAPEQTEALDPSIINQIRTIESRGSKGLLKRVVGKFTDTAPTMGADIRAKFAARDGDALWRAAHGLKSAASAVGAVQVAQRCGEIEQAVRGSGNAENAAAMIDPLETEIAAAVKALQSVIADTDASVH